MDLFGEADSEQILSVGQLTREIKLVLESDFQSIWLAGEISNISRPRSGHLYFSLKDEEAQIRAVIWRSTAYRLKFDLQDGMDVIVRGRLSVYEIRGEYQITVEEIQPKGLGALEMALRQLKEKLFSKGYFEPARKKKLPAIPTRIALVTSPTGAAVRDMMEILRRRWPACEIWVCPVAVQGDGAGGDIARMIRQLNQLKQRPDVMIVGRGGGSLEDLWAFNEEVVADAIYNSAIPVISAVGHEVDITIADLVADRRAATPSEAAELVVPNVEELSEGFVATQQRMLHLLAAKMQKSRERWQDLAERRVFRQPLERIRDAEHKLDDWEDRLNRSVRKRLQGCQDQMTAAATHLHSLSPLQVLQRGYSLTRKTDGTIIRKLDQIAPGMTVVTLLQDGEFRSKVLADEEDQEKPSEGTLF